MKPWLKALAPVLALSSAACVPLHRYHTFHDALSPEEHLQLGQVYRQQGQDRSAQKEFEAALDRDTDFVPALMELGDAAFQKKEYRSSEKYFRRVLRHSPDHPEANNNLAMVYVEENRHLDKAESMALKATRTPEDRAYAFETLTEIYLRQNKPEKARAALAQARQAAGGDPVLLEQLSKTEEKIPSLP